MREFERKKKIKKIVYSRVSIFTLFVISLFLTHATWNVYKKERSTRENLTRVEDETLKLKNREMELKKSVVYLQTDEGIESEIRSKFRGVKEGEQVAIIIDADPIKKEITKPTQETVWMKIKQFFGIL